MWREKWMKKRLFLKTAEKVRYLSKKESWCAMSSRRRLSPTTLHETFSVSLSCENGQRLSFSVLILLMEFLRVIERFWNALCFIHIGKVPKEMELYLGKKFKLEVWETCVKSMRVNEVASFTVEPYVSNIRNTLNTRAFPCSGLLVVLKRMFLHRYLFLLQLLGAYPAVAKSLRTLREGRVLEAPQHHCCGLMMQNEQTLGYPDLDELVKNPQPLEFIIGTYCGLRNHTCVVLVEPFSFTPIRDRCT